MLIKGAEKRNVRPCDMLTVGPRINVMQILSKRHAQKMQHNLTYMLYGVTTRFRTRGRRMKMLVVKSA